MFNQKLILEVRGLEERVYRLECDPSSPLGELYDAINTMRNVVVEQIKSQQPKEAPKEQEAEQVEGKVEEEVESPKED